jgi:hypothetical protein
MRRLLILSEAKDLVPFLLAPSIKLPALQFCPRLRRYRVAKPIEPGPRIEVLPPLVWLRDQGAMGMAHDDEPDRGFFLKEVLGPHLLASGRVGQRGLVESMVAEGWTQEIHEAKPKLRVQYSVNSCRGRVLDQTVKQIRMPSGLSQPIAVRCHHPALTDLERRPVRLEGETQVPLPELIVPPVMVPSDQHDRRPAAQPGERRGDVKAPPGNHLGIGKPEVEEVAVDQQAVAQGGHGVEELEQRLPNGRWRHSKVGIGDDNKGVAQHGAKDGPRLP